MDKVVELWGKYNKYSKELSLHLGRTNNVVGEYAEYLAWKYTNGSLLDASNASADIRAPDGTLYQVKSRKVKDTLTTQLSVIRSWNFNFLFVILFNQDGLVLKSVISPASVAEEYGKKNKHQNGWVISTTNKFLCDSRNIDVTDSIKSIGL
jgi:hypothetical protein